jgi:endonuclease/exonuclease/phosphatase family metal-dependent hydrolase
MKCSEFSKSRHKECGTYHWTVKRIQGIFIFSIIFPALMFLWGCEVISGADSGLATEADSTFLTIATWNLQALFDESETGTEYEEYRASAGWTEEKYTARLTFLSQAVGQMDQNTPDILALQEIENIQVLEELAGGALAGRGYNWTFFANNPGASLGVGILSRFPFIRTKAHSLTHNEDTTPRPILEIWLQPWDVPIVLFICHWKSKVGGDELTESLRRASARIILRRLREIRRDYPSMPIVIMGDLNENHDEFYRQAGAFISALLPDDPKAAELTGFSTNSGARSGENQADFLVLSSQKPPVSVYFSIEEAILYSPWENELQNGSYNYRGEWETIDHFLLNDALFDQEGWEFDSCRLINTEPFVTSQGYPNAYNPRTGYGLSDHLPLFLTLKALPFGAQDIP